MVSRQFRVLETVGSSPAASTKVKPLTNVGGFVFYVAELELRSSPSSVPDNALTWGVAHLSTAAFRPK